MTKKRSKNRRDENRPIFVVGSPRSGTSILTWCLGQHPNILVLPESGWIGDLAIDLAIRYQIGTARGGLSVLSAMDVQREEFFAIFGSSISKLILNHRRDLELRRLRVQLLQVLLNLGNARSGAATVPAASSIVHSICDPKARWVDGTPENSFHICGLRKLFPKALFIHLVRDVSSVVPSMMNFYRVDGRHLVANEQEAYEYWLRAVRACVQAEKAYGSKVIYRLRYSDLITNSKAAIRSVLKFLGEPYSAACLKPLREKINSSRVSGNFRTGGACANPSLVEKAELLSTELQEKPPRSDPSVLVAQKMEANFAQRVQYFENLDFEYRRAQTIVSQLQKELEERAAWALKCSEEFEERTAWALKCGEELIEKDATILRLQKEFEERTAWALKCGEELTERDSTILRLQKEFDERTAWTLSLQKEVEERTACALSLNEELRAQEALIQQLRIQKKRDRT